MSVSYWGVYYMLGTGANITDNTNSSSFWLVFCNQWTFPSYNLSYHNLCTRSASDSCQFDHIDVLNIRNVIPMYCRFLLKHSVYHGTTLQYSRSSFKFIRSFWMFCLLMHKISTGLQNVKARVNRRLKHVVRAGKERHSSCWETIRKNTR